MGKQKIQVLSNISLLLVAIIWGFREKVTMKQQHKALLEKYGAKSVSTLDPQYYDAVLEEASSM